ncbi:zona pellucida sperm-binding protein 3d.2 isoform X2 [Melanotaenia boesemani]|uniref:zona pellucida sperm-binding protein 3d.2 isoform X2 n=1 Tax=Melanotaenia boesemani TaxID=1250792 RepID=UPI001C054B3B|nr:zona pellucida sperm-binding protein 3d.2 isoform X2 [Melanotaenia boesemani]
MVYLIFFLLVAPPDGGALPPEALNQTAQVLMRKVYRKQTPTVLRLNYLRLPMFVDSDLSLEEDGYFSPARSTGQEPLLKPVQQLLLPVRANSSPRSVSGATVKTSCERNMMQVQVGRRIFGAGEPDSHLKLGTCQVSNSTEDYLYFEYELSMCGTKRTMISNRMVYFNLLHYDSPASRGPIRRVAPFSLPVGCYFNRYLYSYTVGHIPKVQMQKIFKETMEADKFILTPRNARWEKLPPSGHYMLGEPIYFEAEAPALSYNQRLYVHTCFVTPEKSRTSKPQVSVMKNFGCVVKTEDSVSKFIPYKNNVVRFSVDSLLFTGMTGQLYMHCTMSAGSLLPTPTAKSCNYDTISKRWVEMLGLNSVCDCCDSSCSSAAATVAQIFSSGPWLIKPKVKPRIPTLQRKTASTTTTTTIREAPQPELSKWKWRSWPEETAEVLMGKVEKTVTELEWPFTGGGVMWSEQEGEEKQMKGSAAVEAEEELKVKELHRIFEDVFGFDE